MTSIPTNVERDEAALFEIVKREVEEASHDDSARWMTCTGCYEGVDGQNTLGFPYSEAFGCVLGGGCQECGGIGAIWDTTDWAAMADDMLGDDAALSALPLDGGGCARAVVDTVSAEGTVQVLRSSATEPKRCVCCAGPHCFAMRAEIEGAQDEWGRKLTDVRSFVENVLWKKADGEPIYDGARFRVTVEVLAAAPKETGQ